MAKRKKPIKKAPAVCLPERRRRYMSTLIAEENNRFVLDPGSAASRLTYSLQGFLEIELGPRGKAKRSPIFLAVNNVNIHGHIEGDAPPHVPREMHGRLATGANPQAKINPETGEADISVPILIEYAELHDHFSRMTRPMEGHLPAARPLRFNTVLKIKYNLFAGGFHAVGAGLIEPLPGIPGAKQIPALLFFACLCRSDTFCLECCVSVKVAKKAGNPVKSDAEVRDIVKKANDIWGCGSPGQCCIKFNLKEIKQPNALPTNPTLANGAYTADFDTINGIEKDPDCYNVYVVDTIQGAVISGQTGFGTKNISILSTSGLTQDTIANNFAHELGHAMGLARGSGTEANGVTAHSSNNDNLMQPTSASKGKLNAKQCAEARKSALLKASTDKCTEAPKET